MLEISNFMLGISNSLGESYIMADLANGLVTGDGTKVLTVEEFDKYLQFIPVRYRTAFEVNVITGLRYVELQRLHDNPKWYSEVRNQIILPPEAQKKVKQKLIKRTVDRLPSTFKHILKTL